MLKKLRDAFPSYVKWGVTKNTNKKYLNMGYKSLIVAVFGYFYEGNTVPFSKYCSIPDYHVVVKEEFEKIISKIFLDYKIMVDISPYNEKMLAETLGLGEIGENNLLLTEDYGSYVFIAEALVKEEISEYKHEKKKLCTHCKKCVKSCPSHALTDGFKKESCLSFLSQKKELLENEEQLFKKASYIFGCDICQTSCPVNKNAKKTQIEKFKKPILSLSEKEILSLTEEEFEKRYGEFAFCYKGVEILKRNVRIRNEQKI